MRRIAHAKPQTPFSARRCCRLYTARRDPVPWVYACQSAIEPRQESGSQICVFTLTVYIEMAKETAVLCRFPAQFPGQQE